MFTPIQVLVSIVIGAIEFFLGVRFLLRLFGANASAPFVRWVYEMTNPLLYPFSNIFPTSKIEGFVFDFTTLFALLVYVFFGYLILQVISYIDYSVRSRKELF